jgi:CRP/FNR family transcriptional regulator, cyclic AMP receptor protein
MSQSKEKKITKDQVLMFLHKMEIFSCLTDVELFQLVRSSTVKTIEKGKLVFLKGDPSDMFYVVYSGKISEFACGFDGLELIIKERRELEFFGEMGILSGKNELVTAQAAVKSELILIPKSIFLNFIKKYSQITHFLLLEYSTRLQQSAEKQMAHIFLDAAAQLAYQILRLNRDTKGKGIRCTQEELALQCGMVRQTVAKIMSKWKKMGWIKTENRKIRVIHEDALQHIISLSSDA